MAAKVNCTRCASCHVSLLLQALWLLITLRIKYCPVPWPANLWVNRSCPSLRSHHHSFSPEAVAFFQVIPASCSLHKLTLLSRIFCFQIYTCMGDCFSSFMSLPNSSRRTFISDTLPPIWYPSWYLSPSTASHPLIYSLILCFILLEDKLHEGSSLVSSVLFTVYLGGQVWYLAHSSSSINIHE